MTIETLTRFALWIPSETDRWAGCVALRFGLSIVQGRRLARDLAMMGDDATNRLSILIALDAKENSCPTPNPNVENIFGITSTNINALIAQR